MRISLICWLFLTCNLFGQDLKLPEEVKVKYGRIKQIEVTTTCKNIKWLVTPSVNIDVIPFSDGKSIIISIDPDSVIEEYEIRAISAKGDIPLISNVCKVSRNSPPIPPTPPEPLDTFQSKLKSLYTEPNPQILNKMSNFFLAASKVVQDVNTWPTTQSMVLTLKAQAKDELQNHLMPLRLEINTYLMSKFGDESKTFDSELRSAWSKEFVYISQSLRRIGQ